jgi:hypothetical protein
MEAFLSAKPPHVQWLYRQKGAEFTIQKMMDLKKRQEEDERAAAADADAAAEAAAAAAAQEKTFEATDKSTTTTKKRKAKMPALQALTEKDRQWRDAMYASSAASSSSSSAVPSAPSSSFSVMRGKKEQVARAHEASRFAASSIRMNQMGGFSLS